MKLNQLACAWLWLLLFIGPACSVKSFTVRPAASPALLSRPLVSKARTALARSFESTPRTIDDSSQMIVRRTQTVNDPNPNYRYVTATGAGAENGLTWDTACDGFTGSCAGGSLVRGNTYYVADGDYTGDGLVTLSKSVSSTTRITIKKATVAAHGTATGWADAMGDGQAVFDRLFFTTSYWTWDGQVGAGNGSVTAYGFKVDTQLCTAANNSDTRTAIYTQDLQELVLQYTEIEQCGEDARFDGTIEADGSCSNCGLSADALRVCNATIAAGNPGHQLRYLYIHDVTRNGITLCGTNNTLIEYIYMARLHSADATVHGQCIQFSAPPMDNNTIRYSTFIDIAGTACMSYLGSSATATYSNQYMYGNLLYTTISTAGGSVSARYYYSPGAMYGRESTTGSITYDVFYVYNNTFYNIIRPETFVNGQVQTDIRSKNNVYVNCTFETSHLNVDELSHNYYYNNTGSFVPVGETSQQNGSSDPFVNAAAGNFALSTATNAGFTLASPYDTDALAVTRGSDGSWDRGAFEYVSGGGDVLASQIRARAQAYQQQHHRVTGIWNQRYIGLEGKPKVRFTPMSRVQTNEYEVSAGGRVLRVPLEEERIFKEEAIIGRRLWSRLHPPRRAREHSWQLDVSLTACDFVRANRHDAIATHYTIGVAFRFIRQKSREACPDVDTRQVGVPDTVVEEGHDPFELQGFYLERRRAGRCDRDADYYHAQQQSNHRCLLALGYGGPQSYPESHFAANGAFSEKP